MTAVLQRRQEAAEASVLQFTEVVERRRQLQRQEAEARRAKHEWRRTDQQLADAEERRDAAADKLDQFTRGQRGRVTGAGDRGRQSREAVKEEGFETIRGLKCAI